VKGRSRLPSQYRERGVRRRVIEPRPPLHEGGDTICDRSLFRNCPSPRVGLNGTACNRSDNKGSAHAFAEAHADRTVPSGLPRDIRIEPDESRIADEVEILGEVADNFRREERRAHALETVRVVHANPEDHSSTERRPDLKPEAPNLEIASAHKSAPQMPIRTFELSHVDGRRFVKPTDRWINLRVDHNSTVTLISELGARQAGERPIAGDCLNRLASVASREPFIFVRESHSLNSERRIEEVLWNSSGPTREIGVHEATCRYEIDS